MIRPAQEKMESRQGHQTLNQISKMQIQMKADYP